MTTFTLKIYLLRHYQQFYLRTWAQLYNPTPLSSTEHIATVLKYLHWLPVSYRIDFKVLLLVYKSLNGLGPEYIGVKGYKNIN